MLLVRQPVERLRPVDDRRSSSPGGPAARPGDWAAGALLLALAATGALLQLRRARRAGRRARLVRAPRAAPRPHAPRRAGRGPAGVGRGLLRLHSSPLVARRSSPRLREGGGQGRGARAAPGVLRAAGRWALLAQWGVPAIVLAWPSAGRGRRATRSTATCGRSGWPARRWLCLAALVSPLEVRYLYALTSAVAVAAATGRLALLARGRRRRGAGAVARRRWLQAAPGGPLGAAARGPGSATGNSVLPARLRFVTQGPAGAGGTLAGAMTDRPPRVSAPDDPKGRLISHLRGRRAAAVAGPLLRLDRLRAEAGQGAQEDARSSGPSETLYYREGPAHTAQARALEAAQVVGTRAPAGRAHGGDRRRRCARRACRTTSSRRCTSRAPSPRLLMKNQVERARARSRDDCRARCSTALDDARRHRARTRCPGSATDGRIGRHPALQLRLRLRPRPADPRLLRAATSANPDQALVVRVAEPDGQHRLRDRAHPGRQRSR